MPSGDTRQRALVRRGTGGDASELARLRGFLVTGLDPAPPERSLDWAATWERYFRAALSDSGSGVVSFVVDAGGGRLAACGVGIIDRRIPGPRRPDGRVGHVSSMVTDPAYRRRGYASSVLAALLDWFRDEGVGRVDLHATAEAEPLYRAMGFAPHARTALTWHDP